MNNNLAEAAIVLGHFAENLSANGSFKFKLLEFVEGLNKGEVPSEIPDKIFFILMGMSNIENFSASLRDTKLCMFGGAVDAEWGYAGPAHTDGIHLLLRGGILPTKKQRDGFLDMFLNIAEKTEKAWNLFPKNSFHPGGLPFGIECWAEIKGTYMKTIIDIAHVFDAEQMYILFRHLGTGEKLAFIKSWSEKSPPVRSINTYLKKELERMAGRHGENSLGIGKLIRTLNDMKMPFKMKPDPKGWSYSPTKSITIR